MNRKLAFYISLLALIGVIFAMVGTAIDSIQYPLLSALSTLRYFTIQSNLIIFVSFLLHAFLWNSTTKKLVGGSVLYITITFLGFAIMLESTWDPVGISLIGSILNHYLVPIVSILYLIFFREEFKFKFEDIKQWILYPIFYLIFLLFFGLSTGDYLYPFMDIGELGVVTFIITVIVFVIILVAMSYILIKLTNKKKHL